MRKNYLTVLEKIKIIGCLLLLFISMLAHAQSPLPFIINNNSNFNDESLYVAVVGEDLTGPPGAHIWVDCKTGAQFPMSPSFNTIAGPVYGGNKGPGGNAMYAACFTRLSDIPNKTIMLPPIQGCRVYISEGSQLYFYFFGATGAPSGYTAPSPTNPTDPNKGILYEMIELTYNQFGFFGNPTRVDSYKYPMGLELFGNNYYKKVGELKTHEEIGAAFKAFVPKEFQGCYNDSTGEILAPSKTLAFADGSIGTMPIPGPYVDYLKPYLDQVWAKYANEDLIFDSGDAGIWKGRVVGEQLTMTAITGGFLGRKGIIVREPTTQETLEGKGILDNVVQDKTTDLLVQAQVCAALNRHVVNITTPNVGQQNWSVASSYYATPPTNYYAKFWHQPGISVGQLSYGFAYDDVWNYSSSVHSGEPTKVIVAFGGYANQTNNNTPPAVSITSPSNGSSFSSLTNITINATATDSDGTVSKVDFYNGSTLLGTDSTSPYSFTWTNVPDGSYALKAVATDNALATGTSTVVNITVSSTNNQLPIATITLPADGASFTAPATITLNATASDSDGTIKRVEFYNGLTKLGEDLSAPFSFIWSNVSAGSYTITAKAIDNLDGIGSSAAVSILVNNTSNCSGVGPNAPGTTTPDYTWEATNTADPTITFIPGSPIAGSTLCIVYINGAGYVMDVSGSKFTKTVTIASGTLVSMYFTYRVGNTGTERNSSASPHQFTVGQCGVGGKNISPTVNITSPADQATFTAPASFTINATASDTDGTISKVDFYNGSTLLGSDLSSPYSYSWTGVTAGTYSITAVTVDNGGAQTTSSIVNVTVSNSNGGCSGSTSNGDYSYSVATSGSDVNWTFIPGAPIAGSTMCIIYINGAGYTMTALGSNFIFSKSFTSGQVLTFYFTYRVGTTSVERNSSATPHTYTVGTTCGGRVLQPVNELKSDRSVDVYPNPVSNQLSIDSFNPDKKKTSVKIYDINGKLIRDQIVVDEIDVSSLEPGVYTLMFIVDDQRTVKRFIKK